MGKMMLVVGHAARKSVRDERDSEFYPNISNFSHLGRFFRFFLIHRGLAKKTLFKNTEQSYLPNEKCHLSRFLVSDCGIITQNSRSKTVFFHFLYSKITNPGGISVNSIFRNFSPYKKHLGQSNGVFNHTNAMTSEWDICMLQWMHSFEFSTSKKR